MFNSLENKIKNLEFRVNELEVKLNLITKKDDDDYNLNVLRAGLISLCVIGLSFFGFMLYRI